MTPFLPLSSDPFSSVVQAPAGDPNYPTNPQAGVNPTDNGSGGGSGGSGGGTSGGTGSSQSFTIDPCAGVVLDYPFDIGWSDGGTTTVTGPGTVSHTYYNNGQYHVTITDSDGNVIGGNWVTENANFYPSLAPVSDQIVSTGDAVTVSSSASEVYNQYFEGYVDWGDGTGLHSTDIGRTLSTATLTAKLDAAGDPGQYNASLDLYSVDQPSNHSGLQSSQSFHLDVAGITIDNLPQDQKQSPGAILVTAPGDAGASFVPVTLTIPNAVPTGTTVKLSINDSAMSEAQVLQGATPDESDAVILGGIADDATDTITWTKGSGTPPWQNLWIEPLSGGDSEAGIVLSLEVDAPTTQTTPPVTGQAKDDADATRVRIMYTPDQPNAQAIDITNKTDNDPSTAILPGQLINLSLAGDGGAATDFSWSFEGNIFKDYATTDVVSDQNAPNYGATTGSIDWDVDRSSRSVAYYYEPSEETTSVMLNCTFRINGQVYTVEAGFKLYEPSSTYSITEGKLGPFQFDKPNGDYYFGMHGQKGANGQKDTVWGFQFNATVDTSALPAPLNTPGKFYITQLITSSSWRQQPNSNIQTRSDQGKTVLDGAISYGGIKGDTGPAPLTYKGAPPGDDPSVRLGQPNAPVAIWASRFDKFNDYLMYLPPGSNSRAVALRQTELKFYGATYLAPPAKQKQTRSGKPWDFAPGPLGRFPSVDELPSTPATSQPEWKKSDLPIGWYDKDGTFHKD